MNENTTTKPVIELKNLKHFAAGSQETHCYTATIYVDGKRFASVENNGHGGCDNVHPFEGGYEVVRELEARIKATFPREVSEYFPEGMEASLESVCCDLVNDLLFAKDWKSKLKRRIVAVKDNAAYVWPAKFKPTAARLEQFRTQMTEYKVLNDLPVDEALEILRATD